MQFTTYCNLSNKIILEYFNYFYYIKTANLAWKAFPLGYGDSKKYGARLQKKNCQDLTHEFLFLTKRLIKT